MCKNNSYRYRPRSVILRRAGATISEAGAGARQRQQRPFVCVFASARLAAAPKQAQHARPLRSSNVVCAGTRGRRRRRPSLLARAHRWYTWGPRRLIESDTTGRGFIFVKTILLYTLVAVRPASVRPSSARAISSFHHFLSPLGIRPSRLGLDPHSSCRPAR
jgi:hypothetical protein